MSAGRGHVVLDLFAGTGVGVAIKRLGATEHAVEKAPDAITTRRANGMDISYEDVWDIEEAYDLPHDTHWGSPPCPSFSAAGKGSGRRQMPLILKAIEDGVWRDRDKLRSWADSLEDPRTGLTLVNLLYASTFMPTYIALEQVPAVLPIWEEYAGVLGSMGYSVWTGKITSEMHGVPQTRVRSILMARRDGRKAQPPAPTHSKYYSRDPKRLDAGVKKWVSMAEALGWGMTERPSPTITGGGTETGGAEPIAKLARYTSRDDWTPRPELAAWPWLHAPATTVAGDPRITAREHHYHGEQSKTSLRLTPEEAAILQSYPRDFEFAGNQGSTFLQIGNAVPPLLAEVILRELWS